MISTNTIILETDFAGVDRHGRGKVRDVYRVDELLIVATDRISAFDYILPTGIPDKGKVLTQLSIFWFDFLRDLTPTHFLTARRRRVSGSAAPVSRSTGRPLHAGEARANGGNRMRGARLSVRLRLEGIPAQWTVCGIPLPAGLRESDRLPEPIFTPSTKAQSGHDENISFESMCSIVGADLGARLRDLTLEIYSRAAAYAETKGIIIADTKFEFGFVDGELVLGDEVLTPDSSRFWPADSYKPGGAQFSYDKQYVRDYLESIHWNKQPPAPPLPDEVARKTSEKYRQAYQRAHGQAAMNCARYRVAAGPGRIGGDQFLHGAGARSRRTIFHDGRTGTGHLVLWHGRIVSATLRQFAGNCEFLRLPDGVLRRADPGRAGGAAARAHDEGGRAVVRGPAAGRGIRDGSRLIDCDRADAGHAGVYAGQATEGPWWIRAWRLT